MAMWSPLSFFSQRPHGPPKIQGDPNLGQIHTRLLLQARSLSSFPHEPLLVLSWWTLEHKPLLHIVLSWWTLQSLLWTLGLFLRLPCIPVDSRAWSSLLVNSWYIQSSFSSWAESPAWVSPTMVAPIKINVHLFLRAPQPAAPPWLAHTPERDHN